MVTFDFKIRVPVGIHVRNAMILCQKTAGYQCDIFIHMNSRAANAKKLIEVMILRVKCGDVIQFVMEGKDEEEALAGMKELCEKNF